MRNDQGLVSRLRVRCYRFRMMGSASFSERHGYHGADVEITTRGDAPEEVRAAVLMHGCAAGIGPGGMRGMAARRCSSDPIPRSEEHTSELQSLMRISYAVFCLKKKNNILYNR